MVGCQKNSNTLPKTKNVSPKDTSDEKLTLEQTFDPNDPLMCAIATIEKKIRNIEKKKSRGIQLKTMLEQGKALNEDQKASASKVSEVSASLELAKEILASVASLRSEYQKKNVQSNGAGDSKNIRNEAIKQIVDLQNNLKRVVENQEALKSFNCSDEKVLSTSEVDILAKFGNMYLGTSQTCNLFRGKRAPLTYQSLLNKDNKIINNDIAVTFGDVYELAQKVPYTLFTYHSANAPPEKKSSKKEDQSKKQQEPDHSSLKGPDSNCNGGTSPNPVEVTHDISEAAQIEASEEWQDCTRSVPSEKKRDSSVRGSRGNSRGRGSFGRQARGNNRGSDFRVNENNYRPHPNSTTSTNVVVLDVTGRQRRGGEYTRRPGPAGVRREYRGGNMQNRNNTYQVAAPSS